MNEPQQTSLAAMVASVVAISDQLGMDALVIIKDPEEPALVDVTGGPNIPPERRRMILEKWIDLLQVEIRKI